MATVIDSLLIELGLDSSKFDTAQKKSIEQLRKFDEQSQKTSKNTQLESKRTAEGFEKATSSLIAFGTAFVGLQSFSSFANAMTATNAALGRNANLFSMSGRELDAWGGVLKSVGGDASSFQSSIQAMQSGIAGIKLGDAAILTPLARLGALGSIDLDKNTVDIYKLADALKSFRDANGEQLTYTLAQQLGLNKETFMVLEQGSSVVRGLYEENYKLSGITEINTKQAQKLQTEWGMVDVAFTGVKNRIMDELYPTLLSLATATEHGITNFSEWDKESKGLGSQVTLLTGSFLTLLGVVGTFSKLGILPSWLTGLLGKAGGIASLLLYSKGAGEGEDKALYEEQVKAGLIPPMPKNVKESSSQLMNYYKSQGLDEEHAAALAGNFMQESSLNPQKTSTYKGQSYVGLGQWGPERQADYAKWSGGKKLSDANMQEQGAFSLYELREGKEKKAGDEFFAGKGVENLANIISSKYERPATEAASNEKRVGYARSILQDSTDTSPIPVKIPEITPVPKDNSKSLWDKLAETVDPKGYFNDQRNKDYNKAHELSYTAPMIGANATTPRGNNTSSTNVQTTIGTVTVNTQATDADGIAKDMSKSLQNNSLINNGIQGNR